jgi:hypothetical protein
MPTGLQLNGKEDTAAAISELADEALAFTLGEPITRKKKFGYATNAILFIWLVRGGTTSPARQLSWRVWPSSSSVKKVQKGQRNRLVKLVISLLQHHLIKPQMPFEQWTWTTQQLRPQMISRKLKVAL